MPITLLSGPTRNRLGWDPPFFPNTRRPFLLSCTHRLSFLRVPSFLLSPALGILVLLHYCTTGQVLKGQGPGSWDYLSDRQGLRGRQFDFTFMGFWRRRVYFQRQNGQARQPARAVLNTCDQGNRWAEEQEAERVCPQSGYDSLLNYSVWAHFCIQNPMTERMFRSQEGEIATQWQENTRMIPLVLPWMNLWTLTRVATLGKGEYLDTWGNIDKVSDLRLIPRDMDHHYSPPPPLAGVGASRE